MLEALLYPLPQQSALLSLQTLPLGGVDVLNSLYRSLTSHTSRPASLRMILTASFSCSGSWGPRMVRPDKLPVTELSASVRLMLEIPGILGTPASLGPEHRPFC